MKITISEEKKNLKEKILKLKENLKAVIIAHNYQLPEIQDIADYLGDSLELAKISQDLEEEIIIFCGVKFMAETTKILSPQKRVFLSVLDAGCPLADTITPQQLSFLKAKNPDACVVSYVNTSAEIKALSDVCCTSSTAVKVVKNVPQEKVIFVPDKNLGEWVKKNVPHKQIINWEGFCYVHNNFNLIELEQQRCLHPDAIVMVHPECPPSIQDASDYVLSTSGMLKEAKKSSKKKFIIGTESGLIYRLKKENPGKEFYPLSKGHICIDMKRTTLKELYDSLLKQQYEIILSREIIEKAQKAIVQMVQFL